MPPKKFVKVSAMQTVLTIVYKLVASW